MSSPDPRSVINLAALRWSLALLAVALLLAATVLAAANHFGRQVEAAHKQALARQAETRIKLDRVHDDERKIRAKINTYQELVRQGRTTPEKRLEWVETRARSRNHAGCSTSTTKSPRNGIWTKKCRRPAATIFSSAR